MIGEAFIWIGLEILGLLPVIALPVGIAKGLSFLTNVIGFVNIFLPLASLLPIILLIIAIRKFNIIMSVVNWVLRLIPFIG